MRCCNLKGSDGMSGSEDGGGGGEMEIDDAELRLLCMFQLKLVELIRVPCYCLYPQNKEEK